MGADIDVQILTPCGGGGGIITLVITGPIGNGVVACSGCGSGTSVCRLPLPTAGVIDGGDPGTGLVPPTPTAVVLDQRVQALGDADQGLPSRLSGFPAGLGKVGAFFGYPMTRTSSTSPPGSPPRS